MTLLLESREIGCMQDRPAATTRLIAVVNHDDGEVYAAVVATAVRAVRAGSLSLVGSDRIASYRPP